MPTISNLYTLSALALFLALAAISGTFGTAGSAASEPAAEPTSEPSPPKTPCSAAAGSHCDVGPAFSGAYLDTVPTMPTSPERAQISKELDPHE